VTRDGLMHSSRAPVSIRDPGARIFRAHQLIQTRDVADMAPAIRGDSPPGLTIRGPA
jgi:hypothetical protein